LSQQSSNISVKKEKNVLLDLKESTLKSNLDIFILVNTKHFGALSGYDLLLFFRKKYGPLISAGTMYAQLYAMERKKLIEGKDPSSGARKFTLTTEGERTLEIVLALKNEVLSLTESIFSP
jgi:DNA-binding PadR family transcriptional regulator